MKKKLMTAALFLAAAFMTAGCGAKTFPEGSKLYGVDVGGMDQEQAREALAQAAAEYSLELTLDDVEFQLNAEQLGLVLSDRVDLSAIIKNYNKDNFDLTDQAAVFVCNDTESLKEALVTAYDAAVLQEAETGEADAAAETDNVEGDTAEGDAAGIDNAEAESAAEADSTAEGDTTDFADSGDESGDLELLDPTAAGIVYDEASQSFIGRDGEDGMKPGYTGAAEQIAEAAVTLTPRLTCQSEEVFTEGEKAADSEAVQTALAEANSYLDLQLTYEFTPDGQETVSENITRDKIASLLTVQADGLTTEIDESALAAYASELAEDHAGKGSSKSKFKTTAGDLIEINVATAGQTVDTQALYDDLMSCLTAKTSGTRTAAYDKEGEKSELIDFGGSYCEVDLTNQMVYCYKDGELKVSSSCVTGCVTKGNGTPTGVYSIFDKNKDRYLQGDGYKSWVNFFVPFNGGIGFHDASWRSVFGGTIYLYSGSHGCINMPYDKVKILYENVEIGTKVVVYGGKQISSGYTQTWSGTTNYTGTVGGGSIKINLSCRDGAGLSYSSSNPAVATVNGSGVVTPVGPGTCTITVHASATSKYAASSKSVSVTIKGTADDTSAVSRNRTDSKSAEKTDSKTNKKDSTKTDSKTENTDDSKSDSKSDSKKDDTSETGGSSETAEDSKSDQAGDTGDAGSSGGDSQAGDGSQTGGTGDAASSGGDSQNGDGSQTGAQGAGDAQGRGQ